MCVCVCVCVCVRACVRACVCVCSECTGSPGEPPTAARVEKLEAGNLSWVLEEEKDKVAEQYRECVLSIYYMYSYLVEQ